MSHAPTEQPAGAAPAEQPAAAAGSAMPSALQAALDKLRQNLATYLLGSFLLAWCLTGEHALRLS